MKTVKLTEQELHMLSNACLEFNNGLSGDWENSGYTPKELKAYRNAEKKLFGKELPKIQEEW